MAVDDLGNVVDKTGGVIGRGRGGKALGKACVGRRGRCGGDTAQLLGKAAVAVSRGLRDIGQRRQFAGQAVHQAVNVVGRAVGVKQAGHIGRGLRGRSGRLYGGCGFRLRCWCRGRLRRTAGTHLVVGGQKLLGVALPCGRDTDLLGKARGFGQGHRFTGRLPYGVLRRGRRRDFLMQDKFNGVALFAVDRTGGGGVVGFGGIGQGTAQHFQRLRGRGGPCGAGVLAVPDLLGVLLRLCGRGGGRLNGDGRFRLRRSDGGGFFIREIFLRGGGIRWGGILRRGAAQGNVDGHELLGLLGVL